MKINSNLIDGVAQNFKHPATFIIPTVEQIRKVRQGDYVKVGSNNEGDLSERFWVLVTSNDGLGVIKATVSNNLLFTTWCKIGDEIAFEYRHVLGV